MQAGGLGGAGDGAAALGGGSGADCCTARGEQRRPRRPAARGECNANADAAQTSVTSRCVWAVTLRSLVLTVNTGS